MGGNRFLKNKIKLLPAGLFALLSFSAFSENTSDNSAPVPVAATSQPSHNRFNRMLTEYYTLKITNPTQAVELIKRIIAQYPQSALAVSEYGYILYNNAQYKEALQQFEMSEKLDPKAEGIKLQIAYTLLHLKEQKKAYEKFKAIAESAADSSIVQKAKEGMASLSAPLLSKPAPVSADSSMTEYYKLKLTDPRKALELIRKIVLENPKNAQAHAEYGYYFYGKKEYKAALQEFLTAEKLNPNNYDIKLQIAYAFGDLKLKKEAYAKFKEIAATSSDPSIIQKAKKGMLAYTIVQSSPISAKAPIKRTGLNALLDEFYKAKKQNPGQAEALIKKIVEKYPGSADAQLEYAYILSAKKQYKEALEHFLVVEKLKPDNDDIKLQVGYTLNNVKQNRNAYYKFQEIVHSKAKPKIIQTARKEMISLAGYKSRVLKDPFFSDLYLDPYKMTRFNDMVLNGQARLGMQFGDHNQIQVYGKTYFNKDSASTILNTLFGIAPAIYNDNSIINDLGIRYTPFKDTSFYFYVEEGQAYNLILTPTYRTRWTNDFRGGMDLYKGWGMGPEFADSVKFPFKQIGNIYGDLSYYSRYDKNWIGQVRVREGVRVFEYQYTALDVFLQLEGFGDTRHEFYNNVVDYGPGITLIPDVRWSFALRARYLGNSYIPVNSPTPNPYGHSYHNFIVECEAFFAF